MSNFPVKQAKLNMEVMSQRRKERNEYDHTMVVAGFLKPRRRIKEAEK